MNRYRYPLLLARLHSGHRVSCPVRWWLAREVYTAGEGWELELVGLGAN